MARRGAIGAIGAMARRGATARRGAMALGATRRTRTRGGDPLFRSLQPGSRWELGSWCSVRTYGAAVRPGASRLLSFYCLSLALRSQADKPGLVQLAEVTPA